MVSLRSRVLAAAAAASLLVVGAGRAHGQVPQVVEVQKLVPSDGIASDKFGFAVDVEGDTVVVKVADRSRAGQVRDLVASRVPDLVAGASGTERSAWIQIHNVESAMFR